MIQKMLKVAAASPNRCGQEPAKAHYKFGQNQTTFACSAPWRTILFTNHENVGDKIYQMEKLWQEPSRCQPRTEAKDHITVHWKESNNSLQEGGVPFKLRSGRAVYKDSHSAETAFTAPLEKDDNQVENGEKNNTYTIIIVVLLMLYRIKLYIVVQILQIIYNMDSVDVKNSSHFISQTREDRNEGESKLLWCYGTSIKEEESSQCWPESRVQRDRNSGAPAPPGSAGTLLRTARGSALWCWCLRCWCCEESRAGSCSSLQRRRELGRLTDLPAQRNTARENTFNPLMPTTQSVCQTISLYSYML